MKLTMDVDTRINNIPVYVPIEINVSTDVLDNSSHGNIECSTSFMKQDTLLKYEFYRDPDKVYLYESTTDTWNVSNYDSKEEDIKSLFTFLKPSNFENATIKSTYKGYTITQKFADFAASIYEQKQSNDLWNAIIESFGIQEKNLLDNWGLNNITYIFDKDFYLSSIIMEDYKYNGTINIDGTLLSVNTDFDLVLTLSDYAKVISSEVEIPDDIKSTDKEQINSNPSAEFDMSKDVLASYNGNDLMCSGDAWSIFANDGWEFDDPDENKTFATAKNSKYEGAVISIYTKEETQNMLDRILNRFLSKETNAGESISKDGCFGYDIKADTEANLPISFNGITFGAEKSAIMDAYGMAYNFKHGSGYKAYTYILNDNTKITFYVYSQGGLREVSIGHYNVWDNKRKAGLK